MALNLIMLGPPGAGKGTQAERFARTRGIPKISTGDILRDAVSAGTDIGRRAKAIIDRGELVSDDVMIGIVRERLEKPDALGRGEKDALGDSQMAVAPRGTTPRRRSEVLVEVGAPDP